MEGNIVCLSRLPNFANVDDDLCGNLRDWCKFPVHVPPNTCYASEVSSCCGKLSNLPAKAAEFTIRGSQTGPKSLYEEHPPLKTKLPIQRRRTNCVPTTPCQVPKEQLEFMTRQIPDPLWNSMYCLERIKVLITSPSLNNMEERVEELWELYLRKSPTGIYLRDVHELSKIIRYFDLEFSKLSYVDRFLTAIFNHMRKGIWIQKSSENDCTDQLRLTFDGFGRALVFGHSKVQQGILQTLLHWLDQFNNNNIGEEENYRPKCEQVQRKIKKCSVEKEMWCSNKKQLEKKHNNNNNKIGDLIETKSIANCQISFVKTPKSQEMLLSQTSFFGAVERSILPSVLEQIIMGDTFSDAYVNTLLIFRKCCENSYCIRSCVVNSQVINASLLKLGYPDSEMRILSRTVELMYALLASEDFNGIKQCAIPNEQSFEMLLYRFMCLMICDGHKPNNNLRNDTMFLIYLFTYNVPELRGTFFQYLRDFAAILTNNIMTQQRFEIILDSTDEDLELIMYIIWILEIGISAKQEHYEIIENYRLIPTLMKLLLGPCIILEEAGIGRAIVTNVKRSAARALSTFARIQPLSFLRQEGIDVMLETLNLFGTNGYMTLDTVDSLLDIIRTILTSELSDQDFDETLFYFADKNAIGVFTGLFLKFVDEDNFPVTLEPIFCKLLICCSEMGKYDEKQKDEFANKKGVKVIIQLIHQLLYSEAEHRHMHPLLHIMVADCIWNCMADCPSALEIFLLYEGMFRLLDLLEIAASPPSQIHIVGVLLELCDYSRCADQMLFWGRRMKKTTARFSHTNDFSVPPTRGPDQVNPIVGDGFGDLVEDSDQSLSALFCELWREEEARMNVLRDAKGVISSIEFPLMSEFGRNYHRKIVPHRPLPSNCPGAACLDLIATLRPRIYLLVKIMTEETNTEATVFGGLSVQNQVTMQIIINFLDLKRGEIWNEISNEIDAEGLVCVESDRTAIGCLLKIFRNKAAAVTDIQKYLLERATEQAAMNERELYNVIRNCQLQDHLMALREAQYYATTSEYFLLIDKKLWDKTEIDDYFRVSEESFMLGTLRARNKSSRKRRESKYSTTTNAFTVKNLEENVDGFHLSIDTDGDMTDLIPDTPVNCRERLPSELRSPEESLMSVEDGFYQVGPAALYLALTKLIAQQKLWKEKNFMDAEREWLMRKKWKMSWYPKNMEHI